MRVRTPRELGALVRDRRRDGDLSQDELARRARVSRRWLAAVEAGKPGAEVGLVLRTLAALDLELDVVPIASGSPGGVDLDEVLADLDRQAP
jgi:HTH-type transcriptional regulator/antitoxin HipB